MWRFGGALAISLNAAWSGTSPLSTNFLLYESLSAEPQLKQLSLRPVRHVLRQASQLNRQAGTYDLAAMPGAGHVSPDEEITPSKKSYKTSRE